MRNLYLLAFIAACSLVPSVSHCVECDGTEILCLDLVSRGEVEAAGGVVAGGDFSADGFMPSDRGGIDWEFGPGIDLSTGRLEVDVMGLVPVEAAELEGGKVSIFTFCGLPDGDMHGLSLQKMPPDYRDGHIFRYGMDDDGLEDNWDSVVITGAGFHCYYSINDPPWQPDETHHITAEWGPAGLVLEIDGDFRCEKPGNGDTFDPADKLLVLANRCQHYSHQHAVARFSDFRLWGNPDPSVCGNGECEPERGEDCNTCPVDCGMCPVDEEAEEVPEEALEAAEIPEEAAGEDASGAEEVVDAAAEELPAFDAGRDDEPDGAGGVGGGCSCGLVG